MGHGSWVMGHGSCVRASRNMWCGGPVRCADVVPLSCGPVARGSWSRGPSARLAPVWSPSHIHTRTDIHIHTYTHTRTLTHSRTQAFIHSLSLAPQTRCSVSTIRYHGIIYHILNPHKQIRTNRFAPLQLKVYSLSSNRTVVRVALPTISQYTSHFNERHCNNTTHTPPSPSQFLSDAYEI